MPSVVLTGGRGPRRRRSSTIKLPRLPKSRKRTKYVTVRNPSSSSEAERAALQSLAQRFQRGNFGGWKSAVTEVAARSAASSGHPVTATNMSTGHTVHAVPITGSGFNRRKRSYKRRNSSRLRGGFLPALIPIIAAAIGAIPGIAGTAVGIASLKEQKRQYNEQMKLQREQMEKLKNQRV